MREFHKALLIEILKKQFKKQNGLLIITNP